jgi:3-deoxy-D-manno-octulosonic-acid transferase
MSRRRVYCTSCSACSSSLAVSPYFLYQAIRYRKYVASLPQRLGYLPVSFNLDGDRVDLDSRRVGGRGAHRARAAARAAERYPRLRIFLSTTTMTGQQVARSNLQYVDASSTSRSTSPSS